MQANSCVRIFPCALQRLHYRAGGWKYTTALLLPNNHCLEMQFQILVDQSWRTITAYQNPNSSPACKRLYNKNYDCTPNHRHMGAHQVRQVFAQGETLAAISNVLRSVCVPIFSCASLSLRDWRRGCRGMERNPQNSDWDNDEYHLHVYGPYCRQIIIRLMKVFRWGSLVLSSPILHMHKGPLETSRET